MDFQLAQSEDERIAVDHVAKSIDPTAKQSSVATNMISSVNAIKVLRSKIKFLVEIFQKSPEVRQNPDYLRRLNQICSQLEVLESQKNDIEKPIYGDVASLNLLSTATKGYDSIQELVKAYGILSKGKGQGKLFNEGFMSSINK